MYKIYFTSAIFFACLSAKAQMPVRNEPRHHNIFENEYIRILNVFIPPYDTTQFHIHNTPSVFTTFTNTANASQLIGGEPVKNISIAGFTWYDSLITPRIHRVWNEDSTWFHVMDIELIAGKPRSAEPPLQDPSLQLSFNAVLANGYHLQLQPETKIQLPSSKTGYLLLSIGEAVVDYRVNGSVEHRFMKSGHYIWIGPGKPSSITSVGNATAVFLLLQLK